MSKKQREVARKLMTTHGLSYSSEYNVWRSMKQRCHNPKNPHYKNYGERGVKVCNKWVESFEDFYKDVGQRPSKKHTLDRINNNGNYEPKNVRWVLRGVQNRNHRRNNNFTYKGETKCLTDWAKTAMVGYETMRGRINLGWSFKQAYETPLWEKPF